MPDAGRWIANWLPWDYQNAIVVLPIESNALKSSRRGRSRSQTGAHRLHLPIWGDKMSPSMLRPFAARLRGLRSLMAIFAGLM